MPTSLDPILQQVFADILTATDTFSKDAFLEDQFPSAAEIARKYNFRLEAVKKKLRLLKSHGVIQAVSVSPKRYRVDRFLLNQLEDDHPLYPLLFPEKVLEEEPW